MIPVDSGGSWRILPDCDGDELATADANNHHLKQYDETMVYNLNKKATSTAVSCPSAAHIDLASNYQNHHATDLSSHVYTIRKPLEYVSTNEAYSSSQDYNINNTTTTNNNNHHLRLSNLSELNSNNNNNLNSNNYYNSSVNLNPSAVNQSHFYAINDDYLNDGNFVGNANEKMTSSYVKHQSFRKQYTSNNFETISTNPNLNENHNNHINNSFAKYDSDV